MQEEVDGGIGRLRKIWERDVKEWLETRMTEAGKMAAIITAVQEVYLGSYLCKKKCGDNELV